MKWAASLCGIKGGESDDVSAVGATQIEVFFLSTFSAPRRRSGVTERRELHTQPSPKALVWFCFQTGRTVYSQPGGERRPPQEAAAGLCQ